MKVKLHVHIKKNNCGQKNKLVHSSRFQGAGVEGGQDAGGQDVQLTIWSGCNL